MDNDNSIFAAPEKNCCFTGHRVMTNEQIKRAKLQITRAVKALTSIGITGFITGGALGFDTIAAEAILDLKKRGLDIRLAIAVPCRDQYARWKPKDIEVYKRILADADEVVCLSERYTDGCMAVRNRFIVDHSVYCLAFVTKDSGGSAYTMRYAQSKNKNVINLAEVEW